MYERTETFVEVNSDQQEANDLLHYIEQRYGTREVELQALARYLYPHGQHQDAMLTEESRLAFVTLSGYLFENFQEEQRLGFPWISHPTTCAVERMASLTLTKEDWDSTCRWLLGGLMQRPFLTEWIRIGFMQLLQLSEQRLRLVMQTVSEGLRGMSQSVPDRVH